MIKTPWSRPVIKESFWVYCFRGLESLMMEWKHSNRNSWVPHLDLHKQEAEREHKWNGTTVVPSDIPPPTKLHLLILPKQFHLWGHIFKHMSLWGAVTFKPPQSFSPLPSLCLSVYSFILQSIVWTLKDRAVLIIVGFLLTLFSAQRIASSCVLKKC